MGPLVSYVITLYNKMPYLDHLLAGLESQKGQFERQFIFVDDGSTDETVSALRARTIGWPNVVILEQKNSGPAVASNHGFRVADGDFIKPVDGDDVLLPWTTDALLTALKSTGAGMSFLSSSLQGNYSPEDPPTKVIEDRIERPMTFELETNPLHLSMRRARMNPSMWLAKADIVREIGGCDEGVFIQDYSVELRLTAATTVARVDTTGVCFPEIAPGRLSDNSAQILHDVNLALVRFLQDNPALPKNLVRYGLRRAATRAWAWASRHGGKGIFSKECALNITALLGFAKLTPPIAESLCAPFRETSKIRLAQANRSQGWAQ